LASIRQWLEEEGGVIVTVQSLGPYLTRIRRKEMTEATKPNPPVAQLLVEAKLPPAPSPPSDLQDRAKKRHGFEYPPGPPDESKLI
jgi:hypothetical protein